MIATEFDFEAIARATQGICANDGRGHIVLVWERTKSWSEAIDYCYVVPRRYWQDCQDCWEYPLLKICYPMTADVVKEAVEQSRSWSC